MTAAPNDLRASDIALAGALAALVLLASVLALETSRLRRRADAPIIDPGVAIPIRVRPVLEVETPGGVESIEKVSEAALPPRWSRSDDAPARAEPLRPSKRVKRASKSAGKPTRTRKRAAADAPATEPTVEDGAPTTDPPDEGAPADAPDGGAPDGGAPDVDAPGPDAPPDAGADVPGPSNGLPAPGDRLGQRAVAAYRERLIRWLSSRFRVNKSGLPRAELLRQRVHATVELDAEGVVLRYAITPGAHPKFDAAARAALDAIVGERVPSPPEQYPGALQRRLAVTFVCTESTCD